MRPEGKKETMKRTAKDFYASQELFSKHREKNYTDAPCVCFYQAYSFDSGVLVEKWSLNGKIVLVEIFPDGNGFRVNQ